MERKDWKLDLRVNENTELEMSFSIYQILPQLIELWGLNVQTEVESRKNLEKVSGK